MKETREQRIARLKRINEARRYETEESLSIKKALEQKVRDEYDLARRIKRGEIDLISCYY